LTPFLFRGLAYYELFKETKNPREQKAMMSFRGTRLQNTKLPLSSVWLLETLAECKGRLQLFENQSPQLLKSLREMSLIESVPIYTALP